MKPKELIAILGAALKLKIISLAHIHNSSKPEVPVIVSLTSIPSRLPKLHYTIRSLLIQNRRPKKILLWLNDSLQKQIPLQLAKLEGDLFEIRYSALTCSHRKLVHTLEVYPEANIITCDDDIIYPDNWLQLLYEEHLNYPDQIIANRCNMIAYDDNDKTLPYTSWVKDIAPGTSSFAIMPAGYGGVFYPPGALLPEATNQQLFLSLTPKADDLWFKAMSYLNGTLCRRAKNLSEKPIPVLGTQKFTLAKTNIKLDKNREQWDALRKHYHFKTPNPDN